MENTESGNGAIVFGYYVDNLEYFSIIVEFSENEKAVPIEEKLSALMSNCVTGLYFYSNYTKNLKPFAHKEFEITDLTVSICETVI